MLIIAAGDISLNGYYHSILAERRFDPLKAVAEWSAADLVVVNLESPITDARKFAPAKCVLRGAPDADALFNSHRIGVVSLANNHMMDFGPKGLVDTQNYLDRCHVNYCGAGKNLPEAEQPLIVERAGKRVGFLSFCDVEQASPLYAGETTPGVAPWRGEETLANIRSLRSQVDLVVVMPHWGVEMSQVPTVQERERARQMVEAGADVILGSHPHVLQPIEEINGKIVAYSLGNFLFSPMYWRGINADDDHFCSKLRLHPLSRKTGWLQIDCESDVTLRWEFKPARLKRSLAIATGWPSKWHTEWHRFAEKLREPDYKNIAHEETEKGRQRTFQRWNASPLLRKIEIKLHLLGLLRGPSEYL